MAKRRREIIDALNILIAVMTAVVKVLENQQASEDKLLEKGGSRND